VINAQKKSCIEAGQTGNKDEGSHSFTVLANNTVKFKMMKNSMIKTQSAMLTFTRKMKHIDEIL
jgi:hypothetical protein